MIEILPKGTKLNPESLVGRIVLIDGHSVWESVGRPRKILSASGSKLVGQDLPLLWHSDALNPSGGKGWYIISPNRDPESGKSYLMASSIRAICDTIAEALLLRWQDSCAAEAFKLMKAEAKAALLALDGISSDELVPDEPGSTLGP